MYIYYTLSDLKGKLHQCEKQKIIIKTMLVILLRILCLLFYNISKRCHQSILPPAFKRVLMQDED